MSLLSRRRLYDRKRLLHEASRAIAGRKPTKAIECYRRILAVEPQNPELHRRLAPLLAQTRQEFDAWQSFRVAGRACLRQGCDERALGIYREAALMLPRNADAWYAVASIQRRLGSDAGAIRTLRDGRRRFRRRRELPQAIFLLRRALDLAPNHVETTVDLARLLRKAGQAEESRFLLEGISGRTRGPELRRVRATQLALFPSVAATWRWLKTGLEPHGRSPISAHAATTSHRADLFALGSAKGTPART